MVTVLLADANTVRVGSLKDRLRRVGCRVFETSPANLAPAFDRHCPAVVVVGLSGSDASAVLSRIRQLPQHDGPPPVILLATDSSEALAVAALRAGVKDYFCDPLPLDDVIASVRRHVPFARAERDDVAATPPSLIGSSAAMSEVRSRLDRVADRDATVLITGETGTGKELAAAMLHAGSRRRHRRLVSINCAAIPEALLESELFGHERGAFTGADAARPGLLRQAHGGTAFLDEIGELSPVAQAKVLRAIESREIRPVGGRRAEPLDMRVVAATNQRLEDAVETGRFRKDLYFRLNVVRIHLPPLRERASDVPALLAHYLDYFSRRTRQPSTGFTDDALVCLQRYSWPGNVRELKNLVEAAFAEAPGSRIDVSDLPHHVRDRLQTRTDPQAERERLLSVLADARWNKSRAARQLRCSRMTLYRRLARLRVTGIDD